MNTYGTLTLLGASPDSYVEPITLAEAQAFLNVPVLSPADLESDSTITAFISGARNQAEICQCRDLVRKQWELSLDYFRCTEIPLRAPLVSVESISYRDSDGVIHDLVQGTDYIVDTKKQPGLVMPPYNGVWPSFTPWPSSAVSIIFTSGLADDDPFWGDAGTLVKNGMKFLISAWHSNRMPFELGPAAVQEYPYTVTACLSHGALSRFY